MAFLDNSGDIILDAVLTETGRKKLASGTFTISKFALGDDEINYTLYNKDHPSGSAYYDLEILQTPILEAFTGTNANINYGLRAITNTNLLYMPDIVTNEKLRSFSVLKKNSIYYLAVNGDTYTALEKSTEAGGAEYVLTANSSTSRMVIFESGLNTATIPATATNRTTYLVGTDMIDNGFTVQVDQRFIANVRSLLGSSYVSNDATDNLNCALTLNTGGSTTGTSDMALYNNYSTLGITDQLVDTTSGESKWTALAGPAGTLGALNFDVVAGLESTVTTDEAYTNYGKTGINIFGGSHTYDYIDTIVYVVGDSTGTVIQLPVRVTRLAS